MMVIPTWNTRYRYCRSANAGPLAALALRPRAQRLARRLKVVTRADCYTAITKASHDVATVASMQRRTFLASTLAAVAAPSMTMSAQMPSRSTKLLVAHRGASAYAPEHTLAA